MRCCVREQLTVHYCVGDQSPLRSCVNEQLTVCCCCVSEWSPMRHCVGEQPPVPCCVSNRCAAVLPLSCVGPFGCAGLRSAAHTSVLPRRPVWLRGFPLAALAPVRPRWPPFGRAGPVRLCTTLFCCVGLRSAVLTPFGRAGLMYPSFAVAVLASLRKRVCQRLCASLC